MKFGDNYHSHDSIVDVQIRTPIYHPNIDNGNRYIFLSYINYWENTNTIIGIVNAIFELSSDPNPKSSYNTTNNKRQKILLSYMLK